MLLHELPKGHDLRMTPLKGFLVRNRQSILWRVVEPSWTIAKHTYDDLGPSWTETNDFKEPPK